MWKMEDVESHKKGLTDKKKKVWITVANSALKRCLAKGMTQDEAEASAIKQANAVAAELAEVLFTVDTYTSLIRNAFYAVFDPPTTEGDSRGYAFWCRDIFMDHPTLGDSLIVEAARGGRLYAVSFEMSDAGEIAFATRDQWQEVRLTYEPVEAAARVAAPPQSPEPAVVPGAELAAVAEPLSLSEQSSGNALVICEAGDSGAPGALVPMYLDVAIIKPGWGNTRDGHYYPKEMLAAHANAFVGAKMYESDHRQEEKSTRTWVSTIKEMAGFTADGAPIGRAVIHDEAFAKKIRALDEAGLLPKMECSILAGGTARKGAIDGKKGQIVEAITTVASVDWVTHAGAGGQALSIVENQAEPAPALEPDEDDEAEELQEVVIHEQKQPTQLPAVEVTAALGATSLPAAARARLAEAVYPDATALQVAIQSEVAYLKEVTGSGRVTGLGASTPAAAGAAMSEAEYNSAFDAILDRHGLTVAQKS